MKRWVRYRNAGAKIRTDGRAQWNYRWHWAEREYGRWWLRCGGDGGVEPEAIVIYTEPLTGKGRGPTGQWCRECCSAIEDDERAKSRPKVHDLMDRVQPQSMWPPSLRVSINGGRMKQTAIKREITVRGTSGSIVQTPTGFLRRDSYYSRELARLRRAAKAGDGPVTLEETTDKSGAKTIFIVEREPIGENADAD